MCIRDRHESYDLIIKRDSTLPLYAYLKTPFYRKFYYSYLNLNGTIFTFKKITWLNDILNNPVYQQLFIEYNRIIPPINKYIDDLSQDNNTAYENIQQSIILLTDGEKHLFKKMLDASGATKYTGAINNLIKSLNELKDTTVSSFTENKTDAIQNNIDKIEEGLTSEWQISNGKPAKEISSELKESIDNEIESVHTNLK